MHHDSDATNFSVVSPQDQKKNESNELELETPMSKQQLAFRQEKKDYHDWLQIYYKAIDATPECSECILRHETLRCALQHEHVFRAWMFNLVPS